MAKLNKISDKMNKTTYKILFSLLISIVYLQTIKAENADTLFQQANTEYKNSNFQKSIELYEQIVSEGYSSSELYFNLGNAYYKANNLPYAILNYERAKLIRPNDEAINYNLQLVNTFKVDQIEEIPEFFVKEWFSSLVLWKSYEIWSYTSVISFFMVIICILLFLFSGKTKLKKLSFVFAILLFVVSTTTFILAHKRYNIQTTKDKAIITVSTVTTKSSPDESGNDLFVLHEGTKVNIEDKVGDWLEVKISDGNKGWIHSENLEII